MKIKLLILTLLISYKVISQTNIELYEQSILNSMAPDSCKIYNNLVQINDANNSLIRKKIKGEDYILVCTWKQNIAFYSKDTVFNTGNWPLWVTASNELRNRIKSEVVTDTNLRLIQLLGLPPDAKYSYFVEIWVRPQDLFRPCPDKEITDSKCDLCFQNNADEQHIKWINENRVSRYYQCSLNNKYPWSQLGYTYDWNPNNKSHVGLSEFIIDVNKTVYINRIVTTSKYLSEQ